MHTAAPRPLRPPGPTDAANTRQAAVDERQPGWDGAGSPKLSLYLDGELVGSSSPAGTDVDWNTDGAWSVSNSRAADGIRGTVGGARVWSVALTAAQVREDFRRGAGIYRGQ